MQTHGYSQVTVQDHTAVRVKTAQNSTKTWELKLIKTFCIRNFENPMGVQRRENVES